MAKLDRNPAKYKRRSRTDVAITAGTEKLIVAVAATATGTVGVEWLVPSELGDYPTVVQRIEVSGFIFPTALDATVSGELCWNHIADGDAMIDLDTEDDVEEALKRGLNEQGGITKPVWKIFWDKLAGQSGFKMVAHNVVLAEDEELSLVLRPDQTDTAVALYMRAFLKARRY